VLTAVAGTRGKGLDYWKRPPLTFAGGLARVVLGAALPFIWRGLRR
jgi:hypothetical protein